MLADNLEDEGDAGEFDDDSYGSDYGDEDSSALIELNPRVAVQALAPVKGTGSVVNDNISAASLGLVNSPFEIVFGNQV